MIDRCSCKIQIQEKDWEFEIEARNTETSEVDKAIADAILSMRGVCSFCDVLIAGVIEDLLMSEDVLDSGECGNLSRMLEAYRQARAKEATND